MQERDSNVSTGEASCSRSHRHSGEKNHMYLRDVMLMLWMVTGRSVSGSVETDGGSWSEELWFCYKQVYVATTNNANVAASDSGHKYTHLQVFKHSSEKPPLMYSLKVFIAFTGSVFEHGALWNWLHLYPSWSLCNKHSMLHAQRPSDIKAISMVTLAIRADKRNDLHLQESFAAAASIGSVRPWKEDDYEYRMPASWRAAMTHSFQPDQQQCQDESSMLNCI